MMTQKLKNSISKYDNLQNNNNCMHFYLIIKIITSLSESVCQMVNKVIILKQIFEDRLNKVEAETFLIKNKQNYIELKVYTNSNNSNMNYNNSINRNDSNENKKIKIKLIIYI